jgi:hypothetical protein
VNDYLGSLAADLPATRPATSAPPPIPDLALDAPSRLSAIPLHFRQRQQRQVDALHKLHANEFVKETSC